MSYQVKGIPSIEESVVAAVIYRKDATLLKRNNIQYPWMYKSCNDQIKYINSYIESHGTPPPIDVFFDVFPDRLNDDYGFSEDYLRNRMCIDYSRRKATETVNDCITALNDLHEDEYVDYSNVLFDIFKKSTDTLEKIRINSDSYSSSDSLGNRLMDKYANIRDSYDQHFITTGWPWLDRTIGGWNIDSEYAVIAGRGGSGKSNFLIKSACAALQHGYKVAYYNGEMSEHQLMARVFASLYNFSVSDIMHGTLSPQEYELFTERIQDFEHMPFYLLNTTDCHGMATVENLRDFAQRTNAQILFIDQISLIKCSDKSIKTGFEMEAWKSRQLKALRDELNIPVIVACQQNRTQDATNGVSTMQLAGSDVIGQDATKVIMIQRNASESDASESMVIHIVKNRDGINFIKQKYTCDFKHMDYKEQTDESANSIDAKFALEPTMA